MKIKEVTLENIRSYTFGRVNFQDGFNCIVGGVGDGKSSILYAIDFALFGERFGRSYEYLLREGKKEGSVKLTFEHKGKTYSVKRVLTRERDRIVQDTSRITLHENDKLVAGGKKSAVDEEIQVLTGLTVDLFREAVWIQQEKLKELLNIEPSRRQSRIDELFGLAEFDACYVNLRDYQSGYEGELSTYRMDPDVTGIENLRREYENKGVEYLKTQEEIAELNSKLRSAEIALNEAEERLKLLEEQRVKIEELRREELTLKAKIQSLEAELERVRKQSEQQRRLVNELNEAIQALNKEEKAARDSLQRAGVQPTLTVEELEKLASNMRDELTRLHGEVEGLKMEVELTQEKQDTLKERSECPLCLQPLDVKYREKVLERLRQTVEVDVKKIDFLKSEIEELEGKLNALKSAAQDLTRVKIEMEALQGRLRDESGRVEEYEGRMRDIKADLEEMGRRLPEIQVEVAKFDLNALEEARLRRDQAFSTYSNFKYRMEALKSSLTQVEGRLKELKDRLDLTEKKIDRKNKIEFLLRLIETLRDGYKTVRPHLRGEYVSILRSRMQKVLDDMLTGADRQMTVSIDESYSPLIRGEAEAWRDPALLSGGERTLLAFAYKIALGQLIAEARTGESLSIIILDEPTESLGPEDSSISRLAEAIAKLRGLEQIIAVTHSEDFAEKAEHLMRVRREAGVSVATVER
jgi:exonuclease SbcC